MDQDFLLRLAQRIRELILRARNDVTREQLRVWAEEFEGQAKLDARLPAENFT